MSFLGKLGNIFKAALPLAAIPFTGGASAALIPSLIGTGLGVAGAVGKGRAEDRAAQNALLPQQQQQAMQAALFNRQAPGVRQSAAARGDLAANVQPVSFSGGGRDLQLSGGLSPALLSQNSRDLGKEISRQALLSQLGQGGPNDPYASFNTAPFQPKQAGLLDKFLQGAGIAGAGLDLLNQNMGQIQYGPDGQPIHKGIING